MIDEGITVTSVIEQSEETIALGLIASLTEGIRAHQRGIEDLSRERKDAIVSLRDMKVTYRVIADAMGTTEQNVYKILRDHIAEKHLQKAQAESD